MRSKKTCEEHTLKEEFIPEYDHLFNDEKEKNGKTKSGFTKKLLKMNKWQIVLSLFVYLLQSLPIYIVPLATADIINITTVAINTGMTDQIATRLIINSAIILVVILQNVATTRWRYYIVSKVLRSTSAGIRSVLVRKLQSLSITYHKNTQSGRVQAKFIKDTESIDSLLSVILHNLIPSIITVIISMAISVYRNGIVALFFVVVIPINVLLMNYFRKKLRATYSDYRVKSEDVSAKLNTMMTMIPVTKSHGLESTEINDLDRSIDKLAMSGRKVDSNTGNFGSWLYVVNELLKASCLVFCSVLAIYGRIDVGDIVLYQAMFSQISNSVTVLINCLPSMSSGFEAVRSVSEIMNATDVELNVGKVIPSDVHGNIDFNNVSYRYNDTQFFAVKNFSLSVKEGECVAFVGSSGSGKSTLMNLLIGFMQATEGSITVDGKAINEVNLSEYRHHISVVPQSTILFPGTIRENITYGLSIYSDESLASAIEMANISEFISSLPKGLDTDVGELGDKLSGGQKQRIAIARALIRNPRILILDEATSALDNISELHVQKAISSSIKGRTTFIVAHRLSTIRDADKIVVMERGECVEVGSYSELMKKKGKFYQLKQLSEVGNKSTECLEEFTC